jgi:hypothetical protein
MGPRLRVDQALTELKNAFRLDPYLSVAPEDATHLCGLDADLCEVLLMALLDAKFLARDPAGRYTSSSRDVMDGDSPQGFCSVRCA